VVSALVKGGKGGMCVSVTEWCVLVPQALAPGTANRARRERTGGRVFGAGLSHGGKKDEQES